MLPMAAYVMLMWIGHNQCQITIHTINTYIASSQNAK